MICAVNTWANDDGSFALGILCQKPDSSRRGTLMVQKHSKDVQP